MKEGAAERSYIAFISYRHLPLDKEAAERIQKRIENYVVPKEYREKFHGKKAGLVFRDEDELPASSSLTDSIYYALDHSEFLIVICTPDLPKSKWCEAEIRYFLRTHDRDHVIAVLAGGTPYESFSPYLLHEFDEAGDPVSDIEPLAANIAGEDHKINKKTFNKETTRIFAALIGCPFDALWQRERRARTNRLLTAAVAAVAVMAVFLGVVMNRNAQIAAQSAQIQEQNEQIVAQNEELTQKNEEIQDQNTQITEQNEKIEEQNKELASSLSTVRVDSGFGKLKSNDVNGALSDALAAMESGDPSVYDPRIEELFATALGAYRTGQLQSRLVYEQTTDIRQVRLTDDGKYAVIADIVGTIRCLDLSDFTVVWESLIKDNCSEIYTNGLTDRVLVKSAKALTCLSLENGSVLWSYDQDSPNYFQCISDDGSRFAVLDTKPGEKGTLSSEDGSGVKDLFRPVYVVFFDTASGQELGRSELSYDHYGVRALSEGYLRKNYGTDFSSGNRFFCCSILFEKTDEEAKSLSCKPRFIIDTQTYTVTAPADLSNDKDSYDSADFYFGCDINDDGSRFIFAEYQMVSQSLLITASNKTGGEYTHTIAEDPLTFSRSFIKYESSLQKLHQSIQPALFSENHLVLFSDRILWIYDLHSDTILWDYAMDSNICSARFSDIEKEILEITTSDGLIQSWTLSTQDKTVIEDENDLMLDQKDLLISVPVSNGIVQNKNDGKLLNVINGDAGKLFQTRYISDPSAITVADTGNMASTEPQIDILGDTGMIILSDTARTVMTFDRAGSRQKNEYTVMEPLSSLPFYILDDEHFVQRNLCYSLTDGSASTFIDMDPVKIDASDLHSGIVKHTRLADGRLLSVYTLFWVASDSLYYTYYPFGYDGVYNNLALLLKNPEINSDLAVYHGHIPQAGASGLIMLYGSTAMPDETSPDQFHVVSPETDTIYSFDAGENLTESFLPALGTQKEKFAVMYENGVLRCFDLETDRETTFSLPDSDMFAARNETIALCFAEGDDYLVSLTSTGIVRIVDMNGVVHSYTSELFRNFTQKIDASIRELFDAVGYIRASMSDDGKTMCIFVGQESHACQLAVIDTENWVVREQVENAYLFDPQTDRIYAYTDNWNGKGNSGIAAYPLHDLEELKQWAEEELGLNKIMQE